MHCYCFNNPFSAQQAQTLISQVLGSTDSPIEVSRISDDEESKSQNSAIPSEVLRSAMKILFIYASRYRHVILVSGEKKLQALAESQQVRVVMLQH